MLQPGFFDLSRRYQSLDAKPDPLMALNKLIPWEEFRPKLLAALEEAGLCVFRRKPAADSDRSQPPIPIEASR